MMFFFYFLLLFPLFASPHPVLSSASASSSSPTCHGPQLGIHYRYHYETELILNNPELIGANEPAGFAVDCSVSYENVWQDETSFLAEIIFESVQFKPRSGARTARFTAGPVIDSWRSVPVLAHIDGTSGQVRSLYVTKSGDRVASHSSGHQLEPTHLNLVVSLLNSLRSRFGSEVMLCFYFAFTLMRNHHFNSFLQVFTSIVERSLADLM